MKNKLQNLVNQYAEKKENRYDLHKGHTMSGDYGWIIRPFGKNEIYLGKNLKEAISTIQDKLEN